MHSSMMTAEQIIGLNQDHLLHIADNSELLGQKFQCHHEVLVPIAKLIRRSELDGIPMRILSSYRSFDHQLAIWNKKYYQEVTLNLRDGSTVNSQDLDGQERVNAILHYSALPGASRHHWGTDFDVFDASAIDMGHDVELTEQEFAKQGPCASLNDWLEDHLSQYQFFKPYAQDIGGVACEPWHISYQPIADKILEEFPLELLRQTLEQSDIGGKQFIMPKFDVLVHKYVMNICKAV